MFIVMAGFFLCTLLPFAVGWPGTYGRGTCPADAKEPWSYSGTNGPAYWGNTYPECKGKEQSPIDISSANAVPDPNLAKLILKNYDVAITSARIQNDGHTVNIIPEDGVERTIAVGNDTYSLRNFHFHWGSVAYKGSEHRINGLRTSLELHLVHMNEEEEIAVVGILFQEQKPNNPSMQPIVDSFPQAEYKNMEGQVSSDINLNGLLPSNPASFYRYQGSLTTPPCSEGVTWSVLKKVLGIGKAQMTEFRQLYSVEEKDKNPNCRLSNNFRPLQSINKRKIYSSK